MISRRSKRRTEMIILMTMIQISKKKMVMVMMLFLMELNPSMKKKEIFLMITIKTIIIKEIAITIMLPKNLMRIPTKWNLELMIMILKNHQLNPNSSTLIITTFLHQMLALHDLPIEFEMMKKKKKIKKNIASKKKKKIKEKKMMILATLSH